MNPVKYFIKLWKGFNTYMASVSHIEISNLKIYCLTTMAKLKLLILDSVISMKKYALFI